MTQTSFIIMKQHDPSWKQEGMQLQLQEKRTTKEKVAVLLAFSAFLPNVLSLFLLAEFRSIVHSLGFWKK